MPTLLHPYRIVYTVAGRQFEWTRYGEIRARVEALAKTALQLMYRGGAEIVSVEPTTSKR